MFPLTVLPISIYPFPVDSRSVTTLRIVVVNESTSLRDSIRSVSSDLRRLTFLSIKAKSFLFLESAFFCFALDVISKE